MPTVTVTLTDLPAFSAAFAVRPTANGRLDAHGLPEWDFSPEAHQTPHQAQAWQEWVNSGAGEWRPAGAQQAGYSGAVAIPERRPLAAMRVIAERIMETLAPACLKIEIAGSIRREKPDCKDVEIVAVGRGAELLTLTDQLLTEGVIQHRLDKNGRKAWGTKYRRCMWLGTPLDLFMPPGPEFGYTMTLRTGDADFSHALVVPRGSFGFNKATGNKVPGLLPTDTMLKTNILYRGGGALDTSTEALLFEAYRLPFVPPAARNLETVRRLAKK